MNDTSPAMEALLTARFAAMTGAERLLMALQMFETAQKIVLSSLRFIAMYIQHPNLHW